MRSSAIGILIAGATASGVVAVEPTRWPFLGYEFEAGPLVVSICATLMTRLIVSLNTPGKKRIGLDVSVTALSVMIAVLWTQAHRLALLPAGISGITFGALGLGIISFAKSQAGGAMRAAFQTFLRTAAEPARDQDQDVLDRIDKADRHD